MKFELYLKKPFWGLANIKNKINDKIRGICQSIKYGSGKKLHVEGGVRLDCPNIYFGKNDTLSANVKIFGKGRVVIGDNVVIGESTVICSDLKVEIGNDSMIAAHCYITDCNHGIRANSGLMREQQRSVKECEIENDVWIGAGCMILAGSHVKEGTVVGANTVINKDVPENKVIFSDRTVQMEERR